MLLLHSQILYIVTTNLVHSVLCPGVSGKILELLEIWAYHCILLSANAFISQKPLELPISVSNYAIP